MTYENPAGSCGDFYSRRAEIWQKGIPRDCEIHVYGVKKSPQPPALPAQTQPLP